MTSSRILFLQLIFLATATLSAQAQPTQPITTVLFEDAEPVRHKWDGGSGISDRASQDFGTIAEGDTVIHTYRFTNTGTVPLVITDARTICICSIILEVPETVLPGATDSIIIQFNSWGRKGGRSQKLTLLANISHGMFFVYLRGKVEPNNDRRVVPAKPKLELDMRGSRHKKKCAEVPYNSLGLTVKLKLRPEDIGQPTLVVFGSGSGAKVHEMLYDRYESFTGEEEYYVNNYGLGRYIVELMLIGGESRSRCFTIK